MALTIVCVPLPDQIKRVNGDKSVTYHPFTRFKFKQRHVSSHPHDHSLVELIHPDGSVVLARQGTIAIFPTIVSLTVDFGEFMASSTFDVVYDTDPLQPGFLVVSDPVSHRRVEIPDTHIVGVACHALDRSLVAV